MVLDRLLDFVFYPLFYLFELFEPNVEKLKAKKDVDGLIKALGHRSSYVRKNAATALGELYAADDVMRTRDKRAVEPLINALKDEDEFVRSHAIEALEEIGDAMAVEPLINVLNDKNEDGLVRSSAVSALGEIRDKRAVKPLMDAFHGEDNHIRVMAAYALNSFNVEEAKEAIKHFEFKKDSEPLAAKLARWHERGEQIMEKYEKKRAGRTPSSGSRDGIKIVDLRPDKEREIERQAQSSLVGEDEDIARKLLSLIPQAVSEYDTDEEGKTITEIQKIGEYLCSNGGSDQMKRIAYRVQALGGSSRHLEVYWGKECICGWLP